MGGMEDSDYKERFDSLKSIRWLLRRSASEVMPHGAVRPYDLGVCARTTEDRRGRDKDAGYARGCALEPVSEESTAVTHPFLDLAPLSAAHFAAIEDRVARLLSTEQDVVIMQGEALLPWKVPFAPPPGPAPPRST